MNTQAAQTLKAGVTALNTKDQSFATSLLSQLESKGKLSDKQWYWVEVLAERTETAGVPDFTKEQVQVGALHGLVALFNTAGAHLKHPKIRLKTEAGRSLQLSVAGPASKAPGTINLTDGRPYGDNTWYGRVTVEGQYEPRSGLAEDVKNDLTAILTALSRHPAQTAAAYGKLTGNCCLCKSSLSDEKSTAVGYGPVCAKRWGLPWGVKAS